MRAIACAIDLTGRQILTRQRIKRLKALVQNQSLVPNLGDTIISPTLALINTIKSLPLTPKRPRVTLRHLGKLHLRDKLHLGKLHLRDKLQSLNRRNTQNRQNNRPVHLQPSTRLTTLSIKRIIRQLPLRQLPPKYLSLLQRTPR